MKKHLILEERERRKEEILDAAERIMAATSFQSVSMRELAKAMGFTVGALYRYFPDKQTLFVEAFLRGVDELIARIDEVLPHKSFTAVAHAIVGFLRERDHYFRMMSNFILGGELHGEALEKFNGALKKLVDRIESLFQSSSGQENSRLLAHAFFSALNGILISFRNYPGRSHDEISRHVHRLAEVIASMFERGLKA